MEAAIQEESFAKQTSRALTKAGFEQSKSHPDGEDIQQDSPDEIAKNANQSFVANESREDERVDPAPPVAAVEITDYPKLDAKITSLVLQLIAEGSWRGDAG